jgi:hypothetical protein
MNPAYLTSSAHPTLFALFLSILGSLPTPLSALPVAMIQAQPQPVSRLSSIQHDLHHVCLPLPLFTPSMVGGSPSPCCDAMCYNCFLCPRLHVVAHVIAPCPFHVVVIQPLFFSKIFACATQSKSSFLTSPSRLTPMTISGPTSILIALLPLDRPDKGFARLAPGRPFSRPPTEPEPYPISTYHTYPGLTLTSKPSLV